MTRWLILTLLCGDPGSMCSWSPPDQQPVYVDDIDCRGYARCTIVLPPKAECTQQRYNTVCVVKEKE